MRTVKKCPYCHTEYSAEEVYCSKCDYDLSDSPVCFIADNPMPAEVHMSSAVTTPSLQNTPTVPVSPTAEAERKCNRCGQISPLTVMKCPYCNNNLSSSPIGHFQSEVSPAPEFCVQKTRWIIISTDQQAQLEISEGQHIQIGWAAELGNYFRFGQKDYVSNRHGMLSVLNDNLYFEDCSRNGSMINNHTIPKGQAQRLSEGDILCFGGKPSKLEEAGAAYFRVERR